MPPKPKNPAASTEQSPDAGLVQPDTTHGLAETLGAYFGELKDATARGESKALAEPTEARHWTVAATRDAAAATQAAGVPGPDKYADWVRRFGFSIEREIDFAAANAAAERAQHTKGARHLSHLKAAAAEHHSNIDAVAAKLPQSGPLPTRPAPFPYAVEKDQVDTIMSMAIDERAGDAFQLTKATDYDKVDYHALVVVGACHPQAVGTKLPDAVDDSVNVAGSQPPAVITAATLDQVIAALVKPYNVTTWRISPFEAAHMKVRAIARWIAAFVRVVAPPLGPPPAGAAAAASVPAPPAKGGAAAKDAMAVSMSGGGPGIGRAQAQQAHHAASAWSPYRVDDNDPDEMDGSLPVLTNDAPQQAASKKSDVAKIGEATAQAVFNMRVGDPHQIAVLFSHMCRHAAANLVFSSRRRAEAAAAGNLPLEAHTDDTVYSALNSDRKTVAVPTGAAAAHVEGRLGAAPRETTARVVESIAPCKVRTIRGTLKGTVDAHGRPVGYTPWSWNLVTLPDGKDYLVDVALCAANVSLKFLLLHHHASAAVSAGEMNSMADGPAVNSGTKDTKAGKATAGASSQFNSPQTAEAIAAHATAVFGAYQPLAGSLQYHSTAALAKAAAAAAPLLETDAVNGTRGYSKAPLLVLDGAAPSVATSLTIGACAEAGIPPNHAIGAWTDAVLTGPGPFGVAQLSTLLSRTCFEPAYFFSDPRHFATLHYPDTQSHLLLAPPREQTDPSRSRSDSGASSPASRHHHRLVTRAQWEAYPRLTHVATSMGVALESHARRATFAAKGCPVYMSVILGNATSTEVQVTVFRGPLAQVVQAQQPITLPQLQPSTSEGQPAVTDNIAALVDRHVAAQHRANSNYNVITLTSNPGGSTNLAPPAQVSSTTGALSIVDPNYFALSREEHTRRTVLSLMLPDVGQYTICFGVRRLDAAGAPLTSFFTLAAAYQMSVSFVPINDPLMPVICEPLTVAKLQAPATSRVASGAVYFAVAPTQPNVVAAAVVNELASGTERRVHFLPWDASTATFNGTCKIEIGSVEIWLGLRNNTTVTDNLESMVPGHLLPNALSASTASLLSTLTATPTKGNSTNVSKAAFELLQRVSHASPSSVGKPAITAASLAATWRPAAEMVTLETDTEKVAKGTKSGKKGAPVAATALPVAPPSIAKPRPQADFIPFVRKIVAVKRIPTKEASLLTNGFSAGSESAPVDLDDYVPPTSLLYVPKLSDTENRVIHGILARTVEVDTAPLAVSCPRRVGEVFSA
jgi:hypothetical protein